MLLWQQPRGNNGRGLIGKMATSEEQKTGNSDKILFAFDFDHTLIEDNSDRLLMTIVPHLKLESKRRELRKKFPCWIDLMNHVMRLQYEHGCGREDVIALLESIELIESMRLSLDKIIANKSTDVVVISDANILSIQTILNKYNYSQHVTVYSNPATFDDKGQLVVSPYHSHCCIRCHSNPNMCKGLIIHGIMSERTYSKVVYVGDGSNDYCAAMHLLPRDHVVARKGYGMAKRIVQDGKPPPQVDIVDFEDLATVDLLTSFLPD